MSKNDFRALSNKICSTKGCDRRIKQNVVDRKPTADLCYRCFKEKENRRGHKIISGNSARARRLGTSGNIDRPEFEKMARGQKRAI